MAVTTTATNSSKGPRMSLELASRLFDWSSIALAIGACIVFVATAAIVWLGIVKEHHWDVLREQANEKIASVELEASKSNAEAAKAHERIAELSTQAEQLRKDTAVANAQAEQARLGAEQARLDLAKFRAPRVLTPEQQAIIVEELRGKISEINVVSKADVESREYQFQFVVLFRGAGLTVHTGSLSPLDTAVFGNSNGVMIWSEKWMGAGGFPDPSDPLYSAIFRAGLWAGSGGRVSFIPDGKTEMVVPDIPTIYIFTKAPW